MPSRRWTTSIAARLKAVVARIGRVRALVSAEPSPAWRVTDVRYWGFPSDRWHLTFPTNSDLRTQLDALSQTLPSELA